MMAKMKSVWAFGQEAPLGPAGAEADAGEPPRRDADQRLAHLVAGVLRVLRRVEERSSRLAPVGLAMTSTMPAERAPPAAAPPAAERRRRRRTARRTRSAPITMRRRRGRAAASAARAMTPSDQRAPARSVSPPVVACGRRAGPAGRRRRAAARAWRARTAGRGRARGRATRGAPLTVTPTPGTSTTTSRHDRRRPAASGDQRRQRGSRRRDDDEERDERRATIHSSWRTK